mgnify:CR=1 FL=1
MKRNEYKWEDKIFNVHPPKIYLQRRLGTLYWQKVIRRLNSTNGNVEVAMSEIANNMGYEHEDLMYCKDTYVRIIKQWMHHYNNIQRITKRT